MKITFNHHRINTHIANIFREINMTQLSIFPNDAYRTRLTATEDLSSESIAKMDELQRHELGGAIFWVMDYWICVMKDMELDAISITPYEIALFDISDKWFGDMTHLLQQMDCLEVRNFENEEEEVEIPWLDQTLITFS